MQGPTSADPAHLEPAPIHWPKHNGPRTRAGPHLMRQLLQSVREGLQATLEAGDPERTAETTAAAESPYVYTTAIHANAGLTRSLAGITLIAREMSFDRDAETTYSRDTTSATYHAQHRDSATALAVEVSTPRQTVAIAVSGSDHDDTYRLFLEADTRLFGNC